MLYNAPAKGDDGCYFVRATNDDKKKHFIQLNKVQVVAASDKDLTIDPVSAVNKKKITAINKANLQAAKENSKAWFGKEKTTDALKAAYSDAELVAECIPPTKVFSADQALIDFSKIQEGRECSVILEYAGMWFAKTAFGPSYNLVQVRLHPEPIRSEYPEEYAFVEEEEEEPAPEPEVAAPEPEVAPEPVAEPVAEAEVPPPSEAEPQQE
jgi:hypothetical protein